MAKSRIAITGSSGLVGTRLIAFLRSEDCEVLRLVRQPASAPDQVFWDPAKGTIDANALEGVDAVINLAGVSIAGKRWSESRKNAIRESRLQATSLLSRTLAELSDRPGVLISTSAVGYYGNGGSAVLTEQSPRGGGFLAKVCEEWEGAAQPASSAGIRVVHPRFGIVMAREGGMLSPLVRLFKFGLGGRIGDGTQYMSWIDIDDLVRVLFTAIGDTRLDGPINAVATNPATNKEFTESLAHALNRPAFIPAPTFGIKAALGQMGEELVLVSQRAVPTRLEQISFEFSYPTIRDSLGHHLGALETLATVAPSVHAARA